SMPSRLMTVSIGVQLALRQLSTTIVLGVLWTMPARPSSGLGVEQLDHSPLDWVTVMPVYSCVDGHCCAPPVPSPPAPPAPAPFPPVPFPLLAVPPHAPSGARRPAMARAVMWRV